MNPKELAENYRELYKGKCLTLIIFNVLSFVFKDRFKKETGSNWVNNRYGKLFKKNLPTFNKLDKDDQEQVLEGSLPYMTPELLVELMINYPFKSIDKSVLEKENKIISEFTNLIRDNVTQFNDLNIAYKNTRLIMIQKIQLLSSYNGNYYSTKTIDYLMNTPQLNSIKDEGIPFQVGNKKALQIISTGDQFFYNQDYKKAIKLYEEIPKMYDDDQNQMSFYTISLGYYSSAKAWLMLYFKEPMYPKYLEYAKTDIEYALKRRPMAPQLWFLYGSILFVEDSNIYIPVLLSGYDVDVNKEVPIKQVFDALKSGKSAVVSIIKKYLSSKEFTSTSNNNNNNNNNETIQPAKEGSWGSELLNEQSNSYRLDYSLTSIASKPNSKQAQLLFKTIRNLELFIETFNDGINFKDSTSPELVIKILYNTLQLEFYAVILPISIQNQVLVFLHQYLINNSKDSKKFTNCLEARLSILGVAFNDGYSLLKYKQLIEESIRLHPGYLEFKFYRAMFNVFKYKQVDTYKESLEELKQCHLNSPTNLKYLYYYMNCMFHQKVPPVQIISLLSVFIKLSPKDGWKCSESYYFLGTLYLLNGDINRGSLGYIKGREIESIHLDCYKFNLGNINNNWKTVFENRFKSMIQFILLTTPTITNRNNNTKKKNKKNKLKSNQS